MYEKVRSQYLFIQSKNKSSGEAPYNFNIDVGSGLLVANPNEVMSVCISSFNMVFDFYLINSTNNSFVLTDTTSNVSTTINIEEGNYSYSDLSKYITRLYDPVRVSYVRPQNKLLFEFTSPHTISFIDKSYQMLGFSSGDTPSGLNISSTKQLSATSAVNEICLKLYGLSPYLDTYNLDTTSGDQIQISNILLAVPFISSTIEPFSKFNYTNLNDENMMFFQNRMVNNLRFTVTDFDDNYVTLINDFSFTLRFDIWRTDEIDFNIIKRLDSLISISKYQLLNARASQKMTQKPENLIKSKY